MNDDKTYLFDINTNTMIEVTREQERATFIQWAAQLTAVFGAPIMAIDSAEIDSAGYAGFHVKQTATHRIEIHRMLVNWRLARVPIGRAYPVPDRFWCYGGLDTVSLILALTAALEWDGADDTEPKGWTRNGQAREQ
jgi:hypothetical protein